MIREDSARGFCCEDISKIENYDKAIADSTQTWLCHHRLETHNSDGEKRLVDLSPKELIALGMYYHRPADELIFLERGEHNRLHKRGKKHSETTRRKMGAAHKGKKLPSHSSEWRRKVSEANKGRHHSEETKRKISEAKNGHQCSDEHKRKISETLRAYWARKHAEAKVDTFYDDLY